MKVSVTSEDINNGVRESCEYCPVALALARALQEQKIKVRTLIVEGSGTSMYYIEDEIKYYCDRLNNLVDKFIDCFDRGEEVQPFKFEVNFVPYDYDRD
jgi:hypothetical protein